MNNVSQISHLKCYGCTVCECVCPKNAITIEPDKEGFLFQRIKNRVQFIESNLKIAIAGDRRLSQSDPRPPKRNVVYKILDERGFDYLARNYLRPKYYLIRKIIPNWLKNIYKEFSCRI